MFEHFGVRHFGNHLTTASLSSSRFIDNSNSISLESMGVPLSLMFNLGTELLIEGLPNANLCKSYRLHASRGYGTSYVTEVRI